MEGSSVGDHGVRVVAPPLRSRRDHQLSHRLRRTGRARASRSTACCRRPRAPVRPRPRRPPPSGSRPTRWRWPRRSPVPSRRGTRPRSTRRPAATTVCGRSTRCTQAAGREELADAGGQRLDGLPGLGRRGRHQGQRARFLEAVVGLQRGQLQVLPARQRSGHRPGVRLRRGTARLRDPCLHLERAVEQLQEAASPGGIKELTATSDVFGLQEMGSSSDRATAAGPPPPRASP